MAAEEGGSKAGVQKVQKVSAVRTEDGGVEEMWYEMKEALRKASEKDEKNKTP